MTFSVIEISRRSAACWIASFVCTACGIALAWQHPLWPAVALFLMCVWGPTVAWRPWLWLFFVPACLPFLNFWPWTGWQAFDEFDLLLLGALAGGYARMALDRPETRPDSGQTQPLSFNAWGYRLLMLALIVATAISLFRGLVSAGLFEDFVNEAVDLSIKASQAQTYESVWNVLRIAKSLVFALLFAPLLATQMQTEDSRLRAQRLFASGMLVGLALVTLVALWERAAYPGLLEFSTHYRITALFWEMHVGGAAIDAYLAIATPFLVWALCWARRPTVWAALAVLALLTCYAVLTTFSRGVYAAVLVPLAVLALGAWARKHRFSLRSATASAANRLGRSGWRTKAGMILALLLVSEVLGVVFGGTFMAERLTRVQEDLDSRVEHWRRGINLLETPLDWAFGKGLGRLPALYGNIGPDTEFSGSVRLKSRLEQTAPSTGELPSLELLGDSLEQPQPRSLHYITLSGPTTNADLGGLFSLTQRVDFSKISSYTVRLRARAKTEADVRLKICEKHMIYEGACHYRFVKIRPLPEGQWQTLTIPLRGRAQVGSSYRVPRFGVFSISVTNAGAELALQEIGLYAGSLTNMGLDRGQHALGGKVLLQNSDFSQGLSSWFASSQGYYLPWHIDNVYLELLIERGLLGLLLMAVWVLIGLKSVARSATHNHSESLARFLAASLAAAAMVGLVSSWMDVPRIAFLVFMVLFFTLQLNRCLHPGLSQNRKIQCGVV